MTHYDFPAKGRRPAVRMTWYDGGFMPPTPEELDGDARLVTSGGILYIGTKGKLLCNEGMPPRLLPSSAAQLDRRAEGDARTRAAPGARDELDSRRSRGRTRSRARSPTPRTCTRSCCSASCRCGRRSKIHYDAANMRVTNNANANQYLTREYRDGWRS